MLLWGYGLSSPLNPLSTLWRGDFKSVLYTVTGDEKNDSSGFL
jgi:hypothetical protein